MVWSASIATTNLLPILVFLTKRSSPPWLSRAPSSGSHTMVQGTIKSMSTNVKSTVNLLLTYLVISSCSFTAVTSSGIRVSNTPGVVNDATATTALFLILSCMRHYSFGERSLRAGAWNTPLDLGKTHDVTGHTIGILGLGGIGLRLAHLVHAFPMRVIYYSRSKVSQAPEWCEYVESMDELFKQSDVVSVHVPLRNDTVHLVGEKEIRAMKKGCIIVNTARGKVIDEEALIRALEDGHVSDILYMVHSDDYGRHSLGNV